MLLNMFCLGSKGKGEIVAVKLTAENERKYDSIDVVNIFKVSDEQ